SATIIIQNPVKPRINFGSKTLTFLLATFMAGAVATAKADDAGSTTALTDPQIAKIVVVADNIDVHNGKLAVKKTSNPEVKAFAETMIRDHTAVNQKAIALAKELEIKPKASATTRSLESNAKKELKSLKALKGADFDKAYIDNEVSFHEAVIGMLDHTLLPDARNPQLKSLLESGRPIFESHLEHAKQIQATLNQ
ncbi:MAG: DUF4142 domain-containing protein, partial [Limisphaerales bacterium]